MTLSPTRAALWLAVTVALALPVAAQDWAAAPTAKAPTAAQQKELDAARAQLDAAAKRYGDLARQYGGVDAPRIRIEQRLLRKPVIGVVLAPDDAAGVRIAGVTPGSAADDAGVRSGDRIVAIDGKAIAGAAPEARVDAARDAMGRHGEKSEMTLRLVREGKEQVVALSPRAGDRLMFYGPDIELAVDQAQVAAEAARAAMPAAREAAAQAQRAQAEARKAQGEAMAAARDAARDAARVAAIAPDVRREIVLMHPGQACAGEHCRMPVIADALRWNGLNLASVDPALGRYFGADDGVLVLSTGPDLRGLQAGDVIRSVDGKAVKSPRELMEALRGRDAGSRVAVGYLRDRKAGTAQVTVPEPMTIRFPAPPAPPAPPAAPMAPLRAPPAPPAAPPAVPPSPAAIAPPPPAPPAPPAPPVD